MRNNHKTCSLHSRVLLDCVSATGGDAMQSMWFLQQDALKVMELG